MDQQKIGAFMAACRKRKKLTQRQLAEVAGRDVQGHCKDDVDTDGD